MIIKLSNFLSKINNEVFIFEYDGPDESNVGCTQPQYPNYHCSNRFDDSNYNNTFIDDDACQKDEVGCTDSTACSCDELRCIGLCGVCSNGDEPGTITQYECEASLDENNIPYVWTEYWGSDNQWQCGTATFGFYNPSNYITPYVDICKYTPIKPNISIEDGIKKFVNWYKNWVITKSIFPLWLI